MDCHISGNPPERFVLKKGAAEPGFGTEPGRHISGENSRSREPKIRRISGRERHSARDT